MREIKFRVWDFQHREMMYENPSRLWIHPNGVLDFGKTFGKESLEQAFDWKSFDGGLKFEVQQSTGLLDKNGREIFEGDLVNFYTPGHAHGPEREDFKNEEVWFDEESAGFVFGKTYYDGWHGHHPYEIRDIEVVGNIFETPQNK